MLFIGIVWRRRGEREVDFSGYLPYAGRLSELEDKLVYSFKHAAGMVVGGVQTMSTDNLKLHIYLSSNPDNLLV